MARGSNKPWKRRSRMEAAIDCSSAREADFFFFLSCFNHARVLRNTSFDERERRAVVVTNGRKERTIESRRCVFREIDCSRFIPPPGRGEKENEEARALRSATTILIIHDRGLLSSSINAGNVARVAGELVSSNQRRRRRRQLSCGDVITLNTCALANSTVAHCRFIASSKPSCDNNDRLFKENKLCRCTRIVLRVRHLAMDINLRFLFISSQENRDVNRGDRGFTRPAIAFSLARKLHC